MAFQAPQNMSVLFKTPIDILFPNFSFSLFWVVYCLLQLFPWPQAATKLKHFLVMVSQTCSQNLSLPSWYKSFFSTRQESGNHHLGQIVGFGEWGFERLQFSFGCSSLCQAALVKKGSRENKTPQIAALIYIVSFLLSKCLLDYHLVNFQSSKVVDSDNFY